MVWSSPEIKFTTRGPTPFENYSYSWKQRGIRANGSSVDLEKANNLNIPFQFNPIVGKLENLDLESLHVKTGEALAISSVLQLHSLLATDEGMLRNSPVASKNRPKVLHINQRPLREFLKKDLVSLYMDAPDYTPTSSPLSLSVSSKMESFLSSLRGLLPKLMVITDQEANHNGFTLMERVVNSFKFYAALFDCLDSTVSGSTDRSTEDWEDAFWRGN